MSLVLALLGALRAALRTHTDLELENLALRQQLVLLRRYSMRPRLGRFERAFWMWLSKRAPGWREALHVVRPETVIRWHRQGFPRLLDLEVPTWAKGSTLRKLGACESHPQHGAREPKLGCTAYPRGTPQARIRRFAAHCCPAYATSPKATLSDVANVPPEPPRRARLCRLFRRTDGDLPFALRICHPAAPSQPSRALQLPHRRLDRAADCRSIPQ